jgi:Flavin-binding monooxygenase-like
VLLNRALPPEKAAEAFKNVILKHCGSPERYGGLKPADNIFEANISMSQDYLAQVAEGKILPKEGLLELTEDTALFADGTSERIDAAVFATGYGTRNDLSHRALRRICTSIGFKETAMTRTGPFVIAPFGSCISTVPAAFATT